MSYGSYEQHHAFASVHPSTLCERDGPRKTNKCYQPYNWSLTELPRSLLDIRIENLNSRLALVSRCIGYLLVLRKLLCAILHSTFLAYKIYP